MTATKLHSLLQPSLPMSDKQPIFWTGLHGCADSLVLASAIKKHQQFLVIITPDNQTALRLEHELAFFLDDDQAILHFPDWEILPYDIFSPLPEIISERLKTLSKLSQVQSGALVVAIATLMYRLSPKAHLLANSLVIRVGSEFNLEDNRLKFENVGYQCVSQVLQHAEFTIRGSIIDLFPMGSALPYRIELFNHAVETIRSFDPKTQRSINKVENIELYPAREFPISDEAIKLFRQSFRAQFPDTLSTKNTLYQDVSKGIMPGGIEYYFPLFVTQTDTLFDYLPNNATLVTYASVDQDAEDFVQEVEARYQQRKYDPERPLLAPEKLFLSVADTQKRLADFKRVLLTEPKQAKEKMVFDCQALPDLAINPCVSDPENLLKNFIANSDSKILFIAETAGHRENIIGELRQYQIQFHVVETWQQFLSGDQEIYILVASMNHGLAMGQPAIVIITESQLTSGKVQQRRRQRQSVSRELENIIGNLEELTVGSPVVHQDHGVGRYLGLQILQFGAMEAEFLTLEYANKDKLYVPVASLHLIDRYTGVSPENAPLHRLGGGQWAKAKKQAIKKIHDVAAELLEINAKRAARKGHAFVYQEADYQAFASAFPFEETPDQQTTIASIRADMATDQPMDRVVCGDVGFGKTEVAMRAAFIAVQSGKQVVVLVPTTLLAQQHFQNFKDRFADWPFRVETLSRFVMPKQQKTIMADLDQGKVDIVIGTHKLLSKDIKYKALGLVVVDEEHRFGVRQKEHFKKMHHQIDLLTLTATPIPRTLNMAMSGLRDISIIASPPPNRHPVKTFISEWHDTMVQEACQREINRGGQVFFLHNEVQSIVRMAQQLGQLIPTARIQIAHGQLPEKELENIMLDFYHQRFNLLLCTTIIESGIDLPSANTIVINRADKLGLAQLHQLRGRVGRSHHRAYAYLLIPPTALMTKDAVKRLEAVEAAAELGAGFMLASHDMEIRGAGELLGEGQSGQIQEIGFILYTELLERTVAALKSNKQPELEAPMDVGPEVDMQFTGLIPEDYLPDIHIRLVFYKRIANASDTNDLRELQIEMIDRFGLLPDAVKNLFSITELKQDAMVLGVKKIEVCGTGGRFVFTDEPAINTEQLIILIQTQSGCYKFDGARILRFEQVLTRPADKIKFVAELLNILRL